MQRFTVPVNTLPIRRVLLHFKSTKWVYQKYAEWILKKYSAKEAGLLSSVIAEGYGGVDRDEGNLKHKQHNTKVIQLQSSKAWIKIQNDLIVGDIMVKSEEFEVFISLLKKVSKMLGISNISFQTSPGTRLEALFGRQYKSQPSFPVIFCELERDLPLEKIKFTFADTDLF
jgi:hypothetical protein